MPHRPGPNTTEHSWQRKDLLKSILEAFDGLIYVSSKDYRVEYINDKLIKRQGYDIGRELCFKALHGRNSPCPFCVKEQVTKGEIISFDVKDPRDLRWYLSVNSPVMNQDGGFSHLAMITDIHERKIAELNLRESTELLRKENILLKSNIKQRHKFGNIVGKSAPMQAVYDQILNAAASDATIIIYGEPGTGKELVARAVHDISERHRNRFVPVHCGAIPETLIESEFFGHKKGAFSGAVAEKTGYIDFADGGTLFLDEIGEISKPMQTKLLRVIEGSGYSRVGDTRTRFSNFRIISATNRNLMDLIEKKRMREDFFYRIHIFPIHLPPLRERKEDLPLLIDHFLSVHGGKKNIPPLTEDKIRLLSDYEWPGNVRELQNVIIRYCATKRIDLSHSGTAAPSLSSIGRYHRPYEPGLGGSTLQSQINGVEKQIIRTALAQHNWHRGKTAQTLGIDRKSLFNKIKKHGL